MPFPLLVASIVTMVAGAAMQAKAASDAARRQREASEDAMRRQMEYQREAQERTLKQAEEYRTDDRREKQDDLTDAITQEFYQPVAAAQDANNIRTTTTGAVSSDYQAAKAKSTANQQKMAAELAGLFGQQRSATRLRQNEAIGMADAGSDIARLGNYASGQYAVDKMKIAEAGQPNAGLNILGGLASSAGAAGLSAGMSNYFGTVTKDAGNAVKVS